MAEITGRIHSLESFGTLDGPGIRFVVFFQGCPLRCLYCHNPDSRDAGGGEEITVSELLRRIESCRSFLRTGGVTLSGGEPLRQRDFALELLRRCREHGFHTALDTAGSLPPEQSAAVIDAADLLLLDIKAIDPELCLRLTGQDNRQTLATLDYCEATGKAVWIRHVLVPEWTLEESQLRKLAEFLKPYRCVRRIELLPFHRMGVFKWRALGLEDPLAGTPEPSADACREAGQLVGAITGKAAG